MKFNQYDCVRTLVEKYDFPIGTEGAIIEIFHDEACLVDISDEYGVLIRTIDGHIYFPNELEKVDL